MKILDLFNEYNLSPEMTGGEMEQPRTEKDRNTMSRIYKAYIVSKDFGWIKWLVDNDKIDRVEVWSTGMTKPTYGYTTEPYTTCKSIKLENTILMVLSIQDKPIEFLCSILK